jgi:hypothetical protein
MPGVREGVEGEKAGAREEGERDEENPRIAPSAGCLAEDEADHGIHDCNQENEPEVGAVVLPVDVPVGLCE